MAKFDRFAESFRDSDRKYGVYQIIHSGVADLQLQPGESCFFLLEEAAEQ